MDFEDGTALGLKSFTKNIVQSRLRAKSLFCLFGFFSFFNIPELWEVSLQPAFHFVFLAIKASSRMEQRRILTARQRSEGSGLSWLEQGEVQHVVHHTPKLQPQDPSTSQIPQLQFHVLGMHRLEDQNYQCLLLFRLRETPKLNMELQGELQKRGKA